MFLCPLLHPRLSPILVSLSHSAFDLRLQYCCFRCPCCKLPHCASHWKPDQHACPHIAQAKSQNMVQLPVCPLCHKQINVKAGQDPNLPMDEHCWSPIALLSDAKLTDQGETVSSACAALRPAGAKRTKPPNECRQRKCRTKMIAPIQCVQCRQSVRPLCSICPSWETLTEGCMAVLSLAQVPTRPPMCHTFHYYGCCPSIQRQSQARACCSIHPESWSGSAGQSSCDSLTSSGQGQRAAAQGHGATGQTTRRD